METSIIITTCGSHLEDNLRPCIDSIYKFTNMVDVEIIVVASGCPKEVKEYLETQPIKFSWSDELVGYVSGVNKGIRLSEGKYVVLLNDDTEVLGGNWIEIFKKPFLEDPKVGITGPLKFFWNCAGVVRNAIGFFCVMIKKELFDKLGYLDEIFDPGMGEDGDFSIKTEIAGYKLVQVPTEAPREFGDGVTVQDFPIWHKGNGTFSSNHDAKNKIIERNTKILEERYGAKPDSLEKIYNICLNHECDTNKLFPIFRKYASLCDHVTEFGVRGVFSTYAFLSARPKEMVSYDINLYDEGSCRNALEVAEESGLDLQFIEQDTLKAEIKRTDLLFIDTLHTYEQLSQELNKHANKVRKFILIHDTVINGEADGPATDSKKQGLNLAIKEFLEENKQWKEKEKILDSNGLTILERIPKVSIIIPTHNRLTTLELCLERVFTYTDLLDKEVIVVPNGCTDDTLKYLESLKNKIIVKNIVEAVGQVVPANVGVEEARGEFVVLLDDDSHLFPQQIDDWIKLLNAPFSSDKTGITGIFIATYPDLGLAMHNGCVMFRKSLWEEVEKFDETFGFGYLYDVDFSLKVRHKGYNLINVGEGNRFPIYHPDSPITTEVKQKQAELITKNYGVLLERYGNKYQKEKELNEIQYHNSNL